jgi:signal transduction histidine kinase
VRFTGSIRFRLSALYSAIVFGLGGLILGLVYLGLRWQLTQRMETVLLVTGEKVRLGRFDVIVDPVIEEHQVRTLDSLFDQFVLDRLARFSLVGLGMLFLLSLGVGWLMAGRALSPVDRITRVAQEIEASDLSRRINLGGPDDELTRLAGTFDAMLDRLEAAFAAQRRFLADTSHDLRNPLAVIRSNVEVTLADAESSLEDWRSTGEIVARNASRMGTMIDGLLATARMQAGSAAMVDVDLAPLVDQAVEDAVPLARRHQTKVEADPHTVMVRGEPVSLSRALTNLLDNAIKATSERVRVSSGLLGGWAYLTVQDLGGGFDPEMSYPGLGLSIVRQVAQLHQGHLAIHTSAGGTTAVIWLPVGAEGDPPSEPPLPPL